MKEDFKFYIRSDLTAASHVPQMVPVFDVMMSKQDFYRLLSKSFHWGFFCFKDNKDVADGV